MRQNAGGPRSHSLSPYMKRGNLGRPLISLLSLLFSTPSSILLSRPSRNLSRYSPLVQSSNLRMMASSKEFPYAPQDRTEVSNLVKSLEAGAKKGKSKQKGMRDFTCKKSTFPVPDSQGFTVDSWRFQDWDYKRDDLPTYARGLFTYRTNGGVSEIATRGYDKFFNVEEVNETQWRNVETNTKGPYELSVKENGCIIFLSGLEGDLLLVCSKHSTGARQDADVSHAVAGERWVEKHLAAVGKTKHDLARELRKRNATAVAELCDDSFEEHVLAYDEKLAGLYLHGINLNLPEFATYSGPLVHQFADEWGFKKAEFLVKDDIEAAKAFLDGCAETGSWNGRDTEGFVIRCQKRVGGKTGPYVDWFFKYKFEEPYLMYRQWREATKSVIAGKVPKYRKHQKITDEYLLYARRRLALNPALGKAYNANHGIIEMRDRFLRERGLRGSDIIRQEYATDENAPSSATSHVVLVPIATIGCGKTTIAVALSKLFGWGHVQNDNITGQKGRPKQFALQVCNSLAQYPVVIADRNNHQKRERKQIIEDINRVVPDVRFVALHYVHTPKSEMLPSIRRATQQRVLERGDNHQTIQAGTKSRVEITKIMDGFLDRFEPIDMSSEPDNGFDEIIDLDAVEDSRHNLEFVINALQSTYPKLIPEPPSPSDLDDAISMALHDYRPDIKHKLSFQPKNRVNAAKDPKDNWRQVMKEEVSKEPKTQRKVAKIEYFALKLPGSEVTSALDTTFASLDPSIASFYRQLQQTRRMQPNFHVTLMHRASIPQNPELWSRLSALYESALESSDGQAEPSLGKCRIQLDHVVWDNRVMCIVARMMDEGWATANKTPHVTIGTAGSTIKPKESNDLLERWLNGGTENEPGIQEIVVRNRGEIWAEARAVLQK